MLPSSSLAPGGEYASEPLNWKVTAALIVMFVMFVAALSVSFFPSTVIGGEPRAFIVASLEVIPFVMLAVLAYIGTKRDWGKVLTVIWLLIVLGGLALNNVLTAILALLEGPLPTAPDQQLPGFVAGAGSQVLLVFALSFLAVVIGALAFVPGVRRWLSGFLPIDPNSFVHTIALVSIIIATLLCFAPLLALGAPPTLQLITNQPEIGETLAGESTLGSLIYRLVWALPGAVFAVGYAVRRDLHAALLRLGFVRPTLRQIAIGIGVAFLLVIGAQVIGTAIEWVWTQLDWPQTDADAFEQLISFAINPLGAVVLGIVAGVSEELAVRGVLQPRLGIVLSNLFFTAVHALQYSWDALLLVFSLGLVFGVLRKRTNTTTSAIAHGVYDFILVILAVMTQA